MQSITELPLPSSNSVIQFNHDVNGPLVALDNASNLYEWQEGHWVSIAPPPGLKITAMTFRNMKEGLLIGIKPGEAGSGGGSFIYAWLILGLLLIIVGFALYGIIRLIKKKRWKLLTALGLVIVAVVILFKLFVNTTVPKRQFAFETGSHYVGETGQPTYNLAMTTDEGAHWYRFSLPTNFYLTGVSSVDSAYLVTSYASPDHLDGDLWKIPTDTGRHVGLFAAARALWGIDVSDSNVFAYGTDISVSHIGNPWQSVPGEVLSSNNRLDTVSFLSLKSNGGVISLSCIPRTHDFWVVTRDHNIIKDSGNTVTSISFQVGHVPTKIVALSRSDIAVLDSVGQSFISHDGGKSWEMIALPSTARMHDIARGERSLLIGGDSGHVFSVMAD